jgi:hypothetical protein
MSKATPEQVYTHNSRILDCDIALIKERTFAKKKKVKKLRVQPVKAEEPKEK